MGPLDPGSRLCIQPARPHQPRHHFPWTPQLQEVGQWLRRDESPLAGPARWEALPGVGCKLTTGVVITGLCTSHIERCVRPIAAHANSSKLFLSPGPGPFGVNEPMAGPARRRLLGVAGSEVADSCTSGLSSHGQIQACSDDVQYKVPIERAQQSVSLDNMEKRGCITRTVMLAEISARSLVHTFLPATRPRPFYLLDLVA
jgi:hypothetical protein